MTTTTITLDDTMSGTVISPFADGFLTRLEMTKSQSPAWQQECFLPYPFNRWSGGRFCLRDARGVVFNFATQSGALFASRVMLNGASYAYVGDLYLECAIRGQEWELDCSDVPVVRAAA